jgi:hypothetical protein
MRVCARGEIANPTEGIRRDMTAMHNKITLCKYSGAMPDEDGRCPVHRTEECLSLYVRFNWLMDVMDKEWKNAKLAARSHVG